jgi:hypothetical protein
MKRNYKVLIIITAFFLFLSTFAVQTTLSDEEANQCAACHTSGRRLIKTVNEMESLGKEEPAESAESVGEG